MMTPTITRWTGTYRDGWQEGDIVPEAFSHPAKVAKGLAFRIIRHLLTQGYVQAGQTVLDPFAGIGGFALPAMSYGLRFVGVELEARFHTLCEQNLTLWRRRYGFTGGTVVQGDSRELRAVLAGAQAGCVVGSPPWAETVASMQQNPGFDFAVMAQNRTRKHGRSGSPEDLATQARLDAARLMGRDYGTTPGQLGALPPGTPPSALVSSPPYAGAGQVLGPHNGIDYSKVQDGGTVGTPARVASGEGYGRTPGQLGHMTIVSSPPYAEGLSKEHTYSDHAKRDKDSHRRIMTEKGIVDPFYGVTPGQLGAMPAGAVVSSPPWEASLATGSGGIDPAKMEAARRDGTMRGHYASVEATARDWAKKQQQVYGTAPEQLGKTTGDTFWSAASQIVAECAALLPVGGIACWVLKDYISKSKRVPFCDQWRQLCESHGFELLEEVHASLVENCGTQETLFGTSEVTEIARKSFFRRLYEKREGSVKIDHEVVLILRKS